MLFFKLFIYQEKVYFLLYEGIKLSASDRIQKGSRYIPSEAEKADLDQLTLVEQVKDLKLEAEQDFPDEMSAKEIEALLATQVYLQEEEARDEWDCETILSTYSTLDNHPSLIKVL